MKKRCSICGEYNEEEANFCAACGVALTNEAGAIDPIHEDHRAINDSIGQAHLRALYSKLQADILFVLDCTESMKGEFETVRETITDFVEAVKVNGVQARVGLLAFRDRKFGEEPELLQFDGQTFTDNPGHFRQEMERLEPKGGGDIPESSLDALMLALRQPFERNRAKVLVFITDAPPHVPDIETKSIDEVVRTMKEINLNQCYLVFRTQDKASEIYFNLLQGSGATGLAFDLGYGNDFGARAESFKKTLLDLGRSISTTVWQEL